jgi:hypothetical protein
MPALLSVVFLILGLVFPSLLNGQEFTNSSLGILCAFLSIAFGRRSALDPARRPAERALGRITAAFAVLVAAILLSQLPSAYRVQERFNRRLR